MLAHASFPSTTSGMPSAISAVAREAESARCFQDSDRRVHHGSVTKYLMLPHKKTACGCYSLLVLLLRSRMASLTILRKTTPVRGWDDSSPLFAAARIVLWKSPIGASFKIKRLTPCLTSSKMASVSCAVAFRCFRPRTRDVYFPGCVFTCCSLNAASHHSSLTGGVSPIRLISVPSLE